ncbi:MAG: DUF4093 domain-containing protein [Clostridia bacterium]|nr:DUF4093 domain-containing protein [Clostridia bacterium]
MPDKLYTKALILCEGKYDKQRLQTVVEAPILTTDGFRIFSNPQLRRYLTAAAEERGLVVVTDSDRAGQRIRAYVASVVGKEHVTQVYVPRIQGRESRKKQDSAEGILGVEGLDGEVLRAALLRAGIGEKQGTSGRMISKQDLYEVGLNGRENSAALRKSFCQQAGLPPYLTANALLDAVNVIMTSEEFYSFFAKKQDRT